MARGLFRQSPQPQWQRPRIIFSAAAPTVVEGSFTANATVKREQTNSFTANAVVFRAGIAGSFTARAVILRTAVGSAQPQLVGADTATTAGATDLSFTIPSATVANDVLVIATGCAVGSGPTYSAPLPSGWTKVSINPTATLMGHAYYYKTADGTEGGTVVTVSMTSSVAQVGRLSCYRPPRSYSDGANSGAVQSTATTLAGGTSTTPTNYGWGVQHIVKANTESFSAARIDGQNSGNGLSVVSMPSFSSDVGRTYSTLLASWATNAVAAFSVRRITWTDGGVSMDAVARKEIAGDLTADATLLRAQSDSFTADAYIATGLQTIEGSFTAAAVVTRTIASSVTTDATIKREQAGSTTADAVVLRTPAGSFTADAVIFRTIASSATADAIIKREVAGSVTADAVISGGATTVNGSFTTDAVVLRTFWFGNVEAGF